jgi:hypothetical protein
VSVGDPRKPRALQWSRLEPFRTLVAVDLEGTYPDTAVVVTYRYKAEYKPIPEDLLARFPIWGKEPYFKA